MPRRTSTPHAHLREPAAPVVAYQPKRKRSLGLVSGVAETVTSGADPFAFGEEEPFAFHDVNGGYTVDSWHDSDGYDGGPLQYQQPGLVKLVQCPNYDPSKRKRHCTAAQAGHPSPPFSMFWQSCKALL